MDIQAALQRIWQIFGSLVRNEVNDEQIEELARIINEFDTTESIDKEIIVTTVNEGCKALVEAGLVQKTESTDPEKAIRGVRSIILRVRMEEGNLQNQRWFPHWVQQRLLAHAFAAINRDRQERTSRSKELAVMLAANIAAIRRMEQKAEFGDLLFHLTRELDEWMDPFLMDRVLILQRIQGFARGQGLKGSAFDPNTSPQS